MEESLQKWFDAICRFTKPLVEDPDDDDGEALTLFAHQALVASNSVSAAVFMPTVGGVWLCEAAATSSEGGASASGLIGRPRCVPLPAKRKVLPASFRWQRWSSSAKTAASPM